MFIIGLLAGAALAYVFHAKLEALVAKVKTKTQKDDVA